MSNKLPPAFLDNMKKMLGASFDGFLYSYTKPAKRGLRFREKQSDTDRKPVPWSDNSYYADPDENLGQSPLHEAGAYYLQEPSAMAAPSALYPKKNEKVLDLCAAPGGKSVALAQYMDNTGFLLANEIVPKRAKILSENIERMGITNCVVSNASPEMLAKKFPSFFDKILVDAPCSGEGMFRRSPETALQWNEDSPALCAARQKNILSDAAEMLAPGGIMCYSTCTFNQEENEGVIESFLNKHQDFTLMPFELNGLPKAKNGMLRLFPHEMEGEGHFICLLKKRGTPKHIDIPTKEKNFKAQDDFVSQIAFAPKINALFKGSYVNCPVDIRLFDGIPILRAGLHILQDGKTYRPEHALALACKAKQQYPLNLDEAVKFISGETIPCEKKVTGWLTPTYQGFQLGFGKASQGQIKNHYPKALRKTLRP
ncbi:MAG: hypothetical protein Q4E07_06945 [Eubacteriales bacterium]|nr:hypothetical protein [Eubacteriales bacterium]